MVGSAGGVTGTEVPVSLILLRWVFGWLGWMRGRCPLGTARHRVGVDRLGRPPRHDLGPGIPRPNTARPTAGTGTMPHGTCSPSTLSANRVRPAPGSDARP